MGQTIAELWSLEALPGGVAGRNLLEQSDREGDIPVYGLTNAIFAGDLIESGCLRVQPKMGDILPPKAKYATGDR